jgi:hypothetical protein
MERTIRSCWIKQLRWTLLLLDHHQRGGVVHLRRGERELGVAVQLVGMMSWNERIQSYCKKLSGFKGGIGLAVCLADVSVTETYRRVRYGHNGRSAADCTQSYANNLVQSLNIKMLSKFARTPYFERPQTMRGIIPRR